jgi:hypothetical protein
MGSSTVSTSAIRRLSTQQPGAARGWALSKALACVLIADAGVHGRPGGKAPWGPPANAALQRLVATRD